MLRFWLKPSRFIAVFAALLILLALASLWTYLGPLWKHHRALAKLQQAPGVSVHGSRGGDWMTESKWETARRWAATIAHTAEIDGNASNSDAAQALRLLADVQDVKHVRLIAVSLAEPDWRRLAQMQSLESMEFRRTPVSAAGMAELGGLPALERLDLSTAELEEGVLPALANLASLKRITVPASLMSHPEMQSLIDQRGDLTVIWQSTPTANERDMIQRWAQRGVRMEGRIARGTQPRRWVVRIDRPIDDISALLRDLRKIGTIEQFELDTPAVSDELVAALAEATLGTERIGISGGTLSAETLETLGQCPTLEWLTLRGVTVPPEALQELRTKKHLFVEVSN